MFPEHSPIWVHGLPGEEAALVVRCIGSTCATGTYLSVVDLQADTTWVLLDEVLRAWYVPTGHVVWVRRDGAVFATPFDVDRLEFSGAHDPLFEGVNTRSFIANMVVGDDGTVVFVQGSAASAEYELVWVDREGREEVIDLGLVGDLGHPALSPDGTELAVELNTEEGREIWIGHLRRGSNRRLTTFGTSGRPAWTPDGQYLTFDSDQGGEGFNLWSKRADGSGDEVLLKDYDRDLVEAIWSPEADWLISRTNVSAAGNGDILAWRVGEDTVPVPLVATEFREVAPALSPNGRFLAYTSNDSGVYHVWVSPFPDVGAWREQVSVERGIEPVWSRDGRELFYRKGANGDLVAVEVETEGSFRIREERVLFPAGVYRGNYQHPDYDVSRDSQRFVMLRTLEEVGTATNDPMIQILNFFTELEERSGGGR